MRLLTFRASDGQSHLGVLRDEQVIGLSVWLAQNTPYNRPEPLDMLYLIKKGEGGLAMVRKALETVGEELSAAGALLPFDQRLLLAPIPRPLKNVVCIGRNYPEHAQEMVRAFNEAPPEPPKYPTVFTKATTAVNGPYSDIPYDASITEKLDWEGELAVIIGKAGRRITREKALDHVFGYTVVNDISARDIQKRHGNQNFLGKSLDGSCPMGPWIVTADEQPDPSNLEIWTRVNGRVKQRANTSQMIFDVPAIIEALSLTMTLEPGDIIATGTPDGVGQGRTPPEFLRPGDVVECGVEGIGAIRNRVMSYEL
jgi:2-keto-4-pentenoate hydratase/2-oxohepta-3-ene-1,7-dioic acid hydratase in catechol pathway